MHPGSDNTGLGPSLGARRPATSNLPPLNELPPPPLTQLHSKFQPYGHPLNGLSGPPGTSGSVASVASVGNLLTPPNTLPGESNLTGVSGVSSPQGLPSFQGQQQQQGLWSNSLPVPRYGAYTSTNTPGQWPPPRNMFSPLDSVVRQQPNSMAGPQPPMYEHINQLPPFPALNMSGNPILTGMAAAQQLQNNHNAYMAQQQQQQQGYNPQSPVNGGQDSYGGRPPPTPTYFNQNQVSPNTQSQASFPFSSGVGISQPSPLSPTHVSDHHLTSNNPLDRTTSLHTQQSVHSNSQSPMSYQRSSFGNYSQTNMTGPVLSNIHSPGSQMALVNNMPGGINGFNSGHAASMQNMYANHHESPRQTHQHQHQHQPQPQHQTPTDRPFKCDACPQSFNRNHDLKRHKRIHLAVKPYPCAHCDKSFSRKDALKRHILVKGCGKATEDRASSDHHSPTKSAHTHSGNSQ